MIKDLINSIAYDNITLSAALTRAKLIASKIKNETLKKWLGCELEGYSKKDVLPDYRMLTGVIYLQIESPYARATLPVYLDKEKIGDELADAINFHKVCDSISSLETVLASRNNQLTIHMQYSPIQVQLLASLFQDTLASNEGVAVGGYMEVSATKLTHILELTKQSLLDTLIELNEQFPNLENEYKMSEENTEKAQSIVTNNIYGSNNNVASGHTVHQTNNIHILDKADYERLKGLGVEDNLLDEVRDMQLKAAAKGDKPSLAKGVVGWLGKVTASVAAKGLYDNIPIITEYVSQWL